MKVPYRYRVSPANYKKTTERDEYPSAATGKKRHTMNITFTSDADVPDDEMHAYDRADNLLEIVKLRAIKCSKNLKTR